MENEINKNQENILAALEAILFAYGEPIEIKRFVEIFKNNFKIKPAEFEKKIKNALEELRQKYKTEDRGLNLVFLDNRVQLVTKPEFIPLLENFIKEEFKENLTPASVETLSLITYMGPLSRAQIDYYRGVNSSFILRSLTIRGLIDRQTDPKRANVYLYRPSFDLLKYLGISKIEELPEYEKFKNIDSERNNLNNNSSSNKSVDFNEITHGLKQN
ncbi:SMC-Scp complex subunit ScpB [Candidatus Wolfebacteria bacterium]|nr:SMC-Scp complex subunit ScpB [Candidatus Wolfebacteria bacterium]